MKLQADILRQYVGKDRFITTNGIFGHLDTAEMTQTALDFITYDSYPNFAYGMEKGVKRHGRLAGRPVLELQPHQRPQLFGRISA